MSTFPRLQTATDSELRATRVTLGDERQDVAALESFSPTRIWAGLRGTRCATTSLEGFLLSVADTTYLFVAH